MAMIHGTPFFNKMAQVNVFVEGPVAEVMAIMLERSIYTVSEGVNENNPYLTLNAGESSLPALILANIGNFHYQSYLPVEDAPAESQVLVEDDALEDVPAESQVLIEDDAPATQRSAKYIHLTPVNKTSTTHVLPTPVNLPLTPVSKINSSQTSSTPKGGVDRVDVARVVKRIMIRHKENEADFKILLRENRKLHASNDKLRFQLSLLTKEKEKEAKKGPSYDLFDEDDEMDDHLSSFEMD